MITHPLVEWALVRKVPGFPAMRVIVYLHESTNAILTDLAAIAGISTAGMTHTADRLEKLGIAKRHAVPNDRRTWMLQLTDDVRAELDAILN